MISGEVSTMSEPSLASHDPVSKYGLYYPYIHIRDENWLKGTILAFQKVRRIVPNQFTVKDQAITKAYATLEGPAGPLLESLFVDGQEVRTSQEWLHKRISERVDELTDRYAESKVPLEWQSGPQAFEMHVGKFLDLGLLELLKSRHLAWHSREPMEPDSFDWVTMHPKVGAAMMSVLALAVARIKGLSIVTPSGDTHQQLLANREEEVFERLLEIPLPPGHITAADVTTEELAHVVITMGFDLTRLNAMQICELLKQGKDLRSFRAAVANFASRIPLGLDAEERRRRLRQEAQAVLDEWNRYTSNLPPYAKEALVDAALDKVPDKALELGLGATVATAVGALPGLLISVAVSAGIKMFRKRDTPLRFLSRVNKVVDRSIGSIYVPQWRALAAQTP
jgi:hypothetical protein